MTIDLVVGVVCMQRLDGGLIFTCGNFQSIKSKKISNDCFVRRLIYSYSDHYLHKPQEANVGRCIRLDLFVWTLLLQTHCSRKTDC